jgi:radical SAM superfamily enzyme YgiQ (UPF0313 family)
MPEKFPPFKVVLISTYELGRQPFGLASPAAWLRREGFEVTCADCAINSLPAEAVREADLVAFYVPMHTATRLAVQFLFRVKEMNIRAHICFYGLYAPMNENYLRRQGADTILGGEFEEGLLSLGKRLRDENSRSATDNGATISQPEARISLNRQSFITPDRQGLPPLDRYARLCCGNKLSKLVGYTETTRGCKYLCRHCPVVPVYNGRFHIVQKEVVLADVRQQVAAGAEHITFGDPDFFNAPGHVLPIVEALHEEFSHLTYDVTIKVEHLLKFQRHLPLLRDTGCALVTTAVESVDNRILQILDKGHTRNDFIQGVKLFEEIGLALNPTFVPFTPWITLEGYKELLVLLNELNLVENIAPIQLAIRLLIPEGSRLLELPETQAVLGSFNEELLTYEWVHPDPRVDELHQLTMDLVNAGNREGSSRREIFETLWDAVNQILRTFEPLPEPQNRRARAAIFYLNEPWYC